MKHSLKCYLPLTRMPSPLLKPFQYYVCIRRMKRFPSHKIPNKIIITFRKKSTIGTKDLKPIALLTFDIPIYEKYERYVALYLCATFIYLFTYPTLIEQNKMSFKYRNTSSEAMCVTGLEIYPYSGLKDKF
jgi:hypothetical protein